MENNVVEIVNNFLEVHGIDNNTPVQIKWKNFDGCDDTYCCGILFNREIICACCGALFSLEEIFEDAIDCGANLNEVITVYREWVDFSAEIGD